MSHLRALLAAVILTVAATNPRAAAPRTQAWALEAQARAVQDPLGDALARDARARRERIERRTVDAVIVDNDGSEREHAYMGEGTVEGQFEGRKFRAAPRGGWFSYELKVDDKPLKIVCRWRASGIDRVVFDVIVDGEKIATESMANHASGTFDTEYELPLDLTRNKRKITVQFRALPDSPIAGLLDVRTVWSDLQE